jgi:hypothetical protein
MGERNADICSEKTGRRIYIKYYQNYNVPDQDPAGSGSGKSE